MSEMETFIMDDRRSTRALSQNESGEENSAYAYRQFMLAQLRKHGGVMTGQELETALLRNYEDTFGPDDRRMVKCGSGGRRKWQNTLDWAKAAACRKGQVATRSKTVKGKRTTYIVLLDPKITDPEWIEWAKAKKKNRGFTKKCPKCGSRKVPLGAKQCGCGHVFDDPNRRIHRLPRQKGDRK